MGHSYFRWLLVAVLGISLSLIAGGAAAFPYLRAASAAGLRSMSFWVVLIAILLADVAVGLAAGLVIVLTDDFVVPVMYAERLPVFAAWRKLGLRLRAEPGPFAVYVFVRLGVAVITSVAMLFLLFPLLVGLFSGAIITGTLLVLSLHLLGLAWSWNPLTIAISASGLVVIISLLLAVLSVVGMPAQVLIQDFGICFIASRFPSVEALLPSSPPPVPGTSLGAELGEVPKRAWGERVIDSPRALRRVPFAWLIFTCIRHLHWGARSQACPFPKLDHSNEILIVEGFREQRGNEYTQ